jgi:hypothetical protein
VSGAADLVYDADGVITQNPTTLTKPPVDLTYWYQNASPGPLNACTVGSVPGGFDSGTGGTAVPPNPNRSRPSFDLTPSTAYSCQTATGQLTWTPGSPGTLVINGTIFFDGDISMSNNANAVYLAKHPVADRLMADYPNVLIHTSGYAWRRRWHKAAADTECDEGVATEPAHVVSRQHLPVEPPHSPLRGCVPRKLSPRRPSDEKFRAGEEVAFLEHVEILRHPKHREFEAKRLEQAKLDEYSEVNIEFHQTIIRMSHNQVLIDMAANLFTHMRMIRRKTIGEMDRADRSIRDHIDIIEALEARNTNRAEELVRNHALGLAEHVARYADYLD